MPTTNRTTDFADALAAHRVRDALPSCVTCTSRGHRQLIVGQHLRARGDLSTACPVSQAASPGDPVATGFILVGGDLVHCSDWGIHGFPTIQSDGVGCKITYWAV